jgi:hypothetical protein
MTNRYFAKTFTSGFSLILCVIIAISLSSCDGFFGKKTNLDFIEVPDNSIRKVAYVPVLPEIKGGTRPFQEIVHMATGFDRFFYVVDSTQGIFALDETGQVQGFYPNPVGVYFSFCAQDRNLDLLVIGKKDELSK